VIRKQADKLRSDRAAHMLAFEKMAGELERLTGTTWGMLSEARLPPNVIFRGDGEFPAAKPIHEIMAEQITQLTSRAAQVEQNAATQHGGGANADSLDKLLEIIANVEKLCPTEPAVRAWFTVAMERVDRQWKAIALDQLCLRSQDSLVPEPRRILDLTLLWDQDGEILPTSEVKCRVAVVIGRERLIPGRQHLVTRDAA
jgi:hypothetical protein